MASLTALRRSLATGSVLLAVSTAFGAGMLVSQARHERPEYRLSAAGLESGLTCDRLRDWYVGHGLRRVTAWGWEAPAYRIVAGAAAAPRVPADSREPAPTSPLDAQTGSATGTNVQEATVDEPDVAKVQGDLLVRIDRGALLTDDLSGPTPQRLGTAPLDPIGDPRLLLSGDRAVVIGAEVEDPAAGAPVVPAAPRTWARTYDLSDPRNPTLVASRLYDGSLVSARQVGSAVRLVLDGGLPTLDFETPSSSISPRAALSHNRQLVRASSIEDWVPRVSSDGGRTDSIPLVECADVAVPETFDGLGTLTLVGFDPASPDDADTTAMATGSEAAYMSPDHLYVTSAPQLRPAPACCVGTMQTIAPEPTRIYGFDLTGISARYVGMGSVDGAVGGSWSMDEHDGVLRVAVASPFGSTSVVTLRPESGRLVDVGHLDGLGVGDQLKSVRWFDDVAVLVTFRQTDPFYVVDVRDPSDLRVLGELHLPGWSSYLHPVGPHLVLGLGQSSEPDVMVDSPQPPAPTVPPVPLPPQPAPEDVDRRDPTVSPWHGTPSPQPMIRVQHAKATLFDISDLSQPRDVDTIAYPPGSFAQAAVEPHQVTWLPDRDTLLTVIGSGYGETRAWVSVLTIRDGALGDRLEPLPATADVNAVRTLPLADGRVVLVAGDSVRFLTV